MAMPGVVVLPTCCRETNAVAMVIHLEPALRSLGVFVPGQTPARGLGGACAHQTDRRRRSVYSYFGIYGI